MTLESYLKVLRERWRVVVAAVVVGLLAAGSLWYLRPKEYTARLTMYVSAQTADTAQSAYQGAQLSQERVTSYVELVGSDRVLEQVVNDLRLGETPDDLADQIEASSATDSVLVDVAVTDRSPQRAADIANAVASTFTGLIEELERPTTAGAPPPVAVRMVRPAAVPQRPSSMPLPTTLVLGLLAGLVAGLGAALARNALDTSVKSPEQLQTAAGAPVLGTIAFDPRVPKHPLTVHEDPQSPRSEAFRQLRTNLQFINVDQLRQVIVITSSLPGEGKTTTLANLGIALASAGYRTLLVEADLRRPKLADLLGLERAVGLTSVLAGHLPVANAVQHWSGGVDLLASGPLPPNPSELLASQHMADVLVALRAEYDMILVDTPPLLPVTDAAAVAPAADGVVLTCRFRRTDQDQVRAAAQAARAVSAPVLGCVFSMVPPSGPRAYAQYNAYYRADRPTTGPVSSVRRLPDHPAGRPTGTVAHQDIRPGRRVQDGRR